VTVLFKIVSGKMAGAERVARRFPFYIGRAASADLQLPEEGVWDRHLEVSFDAAAGFILRAQPNALASLNGRSVNEAVLRNGDLIEIGALKMFFWLGETRQFNLSSREWLTWAGFILVLALQFYLIYWLAP